MATIAVDEGRRSSIEKPAITSPDDFHSSEPTAFERLPDEIIQQILQAVDANGFASLVLLNSKWRSVAQQAHLYAYQLSNCPSYALSHHNASPPTVSEDDLPRFRRLFAKEVKRNLFEAYLRPNTAIIKLISNSISSSSAPGGDGIQYSPSPKGHHLLAYNSSRIHVIDVRQRDIAVTREFKILRRPAATCINDEGTVLAVLLTEMQIDIYDLKSTPPRRTQSLILDNSPRAIALSPCGGVLAAAYEGGIEVSSLNPNATSTERRAVKCEAVDSLSFSFDGTQILGTTVHAPQPNTVILTAPYYDPGSCSVEDDISALWTTSILFPNTSRDCSHAVLIQNGKYEEAGWTFTYDRSYEIFRAVRIDDLRNGTTYFTGPIPNPTSQPKLVPCTLPAASYHGELVSAGFQGKDVWIYGIPEDLDATPETTSTGNEGASNSSALNRRNSQPPPRSGSRSQDNDPSRVPQWQALDKLRNKLIPGRKIGHLEGVHMVKWVGDFEDSSVKERMIIGARGITPTKPITEDDGFGFVDGGRITVIDFDYGLENGSTVEIDIDVGSKEPEVLEEEHRDMEAEVAIVRRRTVMQKRGSRGGLMRAATSAGAVPPVPALPSASSLPSQPSEPVQEDDDPLLPRRVGALPPIPRIEAPSITEDTEEFASIEEQEALESPYAHASPRSAPTLRRAATAAAANRRLHPQAAAAGPVEYRRADGRAEHPHESDADNWVPPPPPYQKEDPGDLPAFLRHAIPPIIPTLVGSTETEDYLNEMRRPKSMLEPSRSHTALQPPRAGTSIPPVPSLSALPPVPPLPHHSLSSSIQYQSSGSSTHSTHLTPYQEPQRPPSCNSRYMGDENIYDVSPPDSPKMAAMNPSTGDSQHRSASDSRTVSSPQVNFSVPASGSSSGQQQHPPLPLLQTDIAPPQQPGFPFALDLHIPSPHIGNIMPSQNSSPVVRRLSNAGTWPLVSNQPTIPAPATTDFPHSAPPVENSEYYLPAPSQDQMRRLNSRSGAPRRLSGGFHPTPDFVGGDFSNRSAYSQPASRRPSAVEDMPLIVSTPQGVSGAFDPPGRHTSGRRGDPPLLAPVPRHPRPQMQSAVLGNRPTVERLETIYSVASTGATSNAAGGLGLTIPTTTRSLSTSTNGATRTTSLSRRQSRAERSAAKNIADAKKKGWMGGRGRTKSVKEKKEKKVKGKKTKNGDHTDDDARSTWTDITTHSFLPSGMRFESSEQAVQAARERAERVEAGENNTGKRGKNKGKGKGKDGKEEKGEKGDKKCVVM
ncbi:hypothetical protein SMACR_00376 [Sordaria macrospora]|uniref:WGS project CABT00000000 data, contig 2.1 n=2 Tax=Sordaria macrospora TaxID=5147 RepID=F7VKY1_SORMK|nr:uncharacterized protein SMAC_00376 [Sordaria macrospora k-hell]KAA8630824.1 hypothetical protein SMACR_00376 [Sordaria macrospora]WPJ59118.1 hypothetical protein SMAC4_00376 [Sordaria macrospora]CCC06158.1 unnamed protein product [Sordaria macrospora k-hell]